MLKADSASYDVIIIGAGISGLVCGCYLAKAGMKVLIAEQHFKPGGYCTSFKRKGFTFDAAAHSFGSYREGGIMKKVLKELDLDKTLGIIRYEPSDIVISPDHKISFWTDAKKIAQELQEAFPREAREIDIFFRFLLNLKPVDLATLRNKTFKDLLDHYFYDEQLKSIISFPILGVGGLPPSLISAFSATTLYTEFFLDGGYYPEGGMQGLPDALSRKFKEFGGELKFSCMVKKIIVKSNRIQGVELDGGFIPSEHVVSCCDVRQTFVELLEQDATNKEFSDNLKNMMPSISVFIAYLGIGDYSGELSLPGVSFWVMPHYDIEDMYFSSIKNNKINDSTAFMIHVPPDKKSLEALTIASFNDETFWKHNKRIYLENFISRIESVFPGFSQSIVYKDAATPNTLFRYTLNYKGAAYGWASTNAQLFTKGLTQASFIQGLFLSGHWTTQTQGVSGVAYIGHQTAKLILKRKK
jgi:phytoene dehydrogenase-like protein